MSMYTIRLGNSFFLLLFVVYLYVYLSESVRGKRCKRQIKQIADNNFFSETISVTFIKELGLLLLSTLFLTRDVPLPVSKATPPVYASAHYTPLTSFQHVFTSPQLCFMHTDSYYLSRSPT